MKFFEIFAAMLIAPLAALAAPKCTPGKVYCGKVLLDAGDYTEAQLANLIEKDVGNGSVPAVDVALFTCLEAGNEIEYEGSFCLCECVGSDNPDEVCSLEI
ncbi:hypothetical protein N3K66_006468 [Trichothecium roseum]|uniref:Uncharacterized protein n=1 Tax=Trichothecium roseum TaxID=47278 RepID=A0ACC0UX68_9HYPO|nr:hypothetical protein N3K66_006468 [Trichothecium roseum]